MESLDRALGRLGTKSQATLGELADSVREDMKERGVGQVPELTPEVPEVRALRLFDRANLSFGVKVVHALSREELRGAVVKIAGLERSGESPAVFRGLAAGRYRVEVSLEGFFREVGELELEERGSGGTLEVAVSPEYVTMEGAVVDEEGKPLSGLPCALQGSCAGFLRGYHNYEATTDARGRFVFRVPADASVRAVEVSGGPRGRRELALELSLEVSDDQGIAGVVVNGEEKPVARGEKAARVEVGWSLRVGENPVRFEVRDVSGKTTAREVVVVRLEAEKFPGFTFLGKNAEGRPEYRHDRTGIAFVLVPGGTFRMGSPDGEEGRNPDEGPVHEVEVSLFLIGKYEVTQAEWERVMGGNPSRFKGSDHPVECVSWNDCQEFCRKTGLELPTEAQWEYACRAETSGPYAGTGRLDDMGWYSNSGGTTHPVGKKSPNAFGLYDMHGNVWEWCADRYDEGYYARSPRKDPAGPSSGTKRVMRGGSWSSAVTGGCCSANRDGVEPDGRIIYCLFRVAARVRRGRGSRRGPAGRPSGTISFPRPGPTEDGVL